MPRAIPAPSDKFYTAPETKESRIAAITATLRPVDHNGHQIAQPPAVTAVVPSPTPAETPTLATAIGSVATGLGVDIEVLADSVSFMEAVVKLDATDTAAITALVNDSVAANPHLANPTRSMRPNPGQGATGNNAPVPAPKTLQERVSAQLSGLPRVNAQGHPIN